MTENPTIYLGLDVGKTTHHATALSAEGKKIWDKPLPQSEPTIRELLNHLSSKGIVLLVVDQPKTIGALPVAIAQTIGIEVAYLPGLTMRRVADLHPGGESKDRRPRRVHHRKKQPAPCPTPCTALQWLKKPQQSYSCSAVLTMT